MSMKSWARPIAPVFLAVVLAAPSSASAAKTPVAADPVIEAVVFDGVSMAEHATILQRIGVRVGDVLTVETRHRLGRQLNVVGDARSFSFAHAGLTFSDRAGSRTGRVILVIAAGC